MRRLCILVAIVATTAMLLVSGGASAAGIISALDVAPSVLNNGASALGTVTLAGPDPGATQVLLFSSDTTAATVPASITIPAGATSGTFTVSTNAAAPQTGVQITAWVGNTPRSANIIVNQQPPPGGPTLTSVSLTPTSVTGGSGVTGTVKFSGATDGAGVQLTSSNPAVASVPAEAVVNKGASSGFFAVTPSPVSSATTVTITATWLGIQRTATLTVIPGAPAPADKVVIKTATWRKGLLRIEATSTNPNAILTVFTGDSTTPGFTLTNNGGGKFSDQRGFITNPLRITVRSNFGGSASANT